MPISFTITADTAAEFADTARQALSFLSGGAPAYVHREEPVEVQTFGPLPEQPPEPAPASEAEAESPKRGRGRPRGTTAAAKAAAEEAEAEWIVRRYGGQQDSIHPSPASAAARVVELIGAAGEALAITQLMDANGELIEALPAMYSMQVNDAAEQTLAALDAPAPPPAQPQAPLPAPPAAWPAAENGKPLTQVARDKQGARDVIMAIATGPVPKFGHMAALAVLEKHGIAKLSDIPNDGDPRFGEIAAAGAALLGVPVAAPSLV
jgi:hypothetical protein